MAKIANVALTNTFNTWRTYSNIAFDRLSQFAINNSSLYANTITANVAFTSTGLATLSGRATVGTNLTVSGNTSTNKATVTSSLTVSGNTTLGAAGKTITTTGAAAHTGTQSVSTNLTVSGNTSTNKSTVTSSLTVSGNTTLGAAGKTITTTGAAAHTGTKTISTNLTVSGNTTLGAAGKTITTTGAAAHTGTQSVSTNLTVSGNTTLGAANVTTLTASADSSFTSTGAVKIPASTTANRPAGTTGQIRYNTSINTFEGYGAASWGSIGGGATGGAGDTVFQENQLIVTTSYTLSTGKSAMSVGPITINSGVAVTVPSGYRWMVL